LNHCQRITLRETIDLEIPLLGKTIAENVANTPSRNEAVIRSYHKPLKENEGFIVLKGNLFDAGIMKTSDPGKAAI
jgi:dihydroxyacid dehydratase/phosphogluconate dehydratase